MQKYQRDQTPVKKSYCHQSEHEPDKNVEVAALHAAERRRDQDSRCGFAMVWCSDEPMVRNQQTVPASPICTSGGTRVLQHFRRPKESELFRFTNSIDAQARRIHVKLPRPGKTRTHILIGIIAAKLR